MAARKGEEKFNIYARCSCGREHEAARVIVAARSKDLTRRFCLSGEDVNVIGVMRMLLPIKHFVVWQHNRASFFLNY